MSDPIRILQDDDEFERALLASASSDAGSNAALNRALGALSAAAVVGTGSLGTASASAAAVSALSVAKWAGVGALVGGLGMSAASMVVHSAREARPATPSAQVRLTKAPQRAPALGPIGGERAAPAQAPSAPAPEVAPAPARAASAAVAERGSQLGAELVELRAARSALNSGDPAQALRLLDGFQRSFPSAALAPEATLLRLEALVEAGQSENARRLGERLLQGQPTGPHADRVRALLRRAGSAPSNP
jgi:hypothetical protein